jgi:hypothetical protein
MSTSVCLAAAPYISFKVEPVRPWLYWVDQEAVNHPHQFDIRFYDVTGGRIW